MKFYIHFNKFGVAVNVFTKSDVKDDLGRIVETLPIDVSSEEEALKFIGKRKHEIFS